MGRLVDSSIFIDFERRGHDVGSMKAALGYEVAVIAAITASELLVGLYSADTTARMEEREAFLHDLLSWVHVEPFDITIARTHAQLWTKLTRTGQRIGSHDLIIAATAIARGHSVVTHDFRDFRKVPGLVVDEPEW